MEFPKLSKKNRQALAWSLIAIAASFVAIGTALAVVFLGSHGNDPADILPADATIALVRNADADVIGELNRYLTGFDGIPLPDHPVDVALLRLPDGNRAWAILDSATAPLGTRFRITASDAAAQGLIGHDGAVLAESDAYQDIKPFLPDGATGAYLTFPGITWNRDAALSSLILPQAPVGVVFEAARTRVVLPSAASGMDWTANRVPNAFERPSLILAADDAAATLAQASAFLPADAHASFQSAVRTKLAALFGTGVSPSFDLLPLVSNAFSLQTSGGSVVVAGEAKNAQAARALATKLHEAFASAIPGIEVVSRPLDEKFSYTGIRQTDDTAERTTERVGGYDVETSRQRSGSGAFLTAIRGSSVLLGNDAAALKRAIASAPAPVAEGSVALLSAERADLRTLWKTFLPSLQPFAGPDGGPVRWSVSREGGSLVIDLSR